MLEDALDIADTDPQMCAALLGKAVEHAVEHRFWAARHWQPRHKGTLRALSDLDGPLARHVRQFHQGIELAERIDAARAAVLHSVGATGFFEWESDVEALRTVSEHTV